MFDAKQAFRARGRPQLKATAAAVAILLLMQYQPAIGQVFIQGTNAGNTVTDTVGHDYGTAGSSVPIVRATGAGVTYTGDSIKGVIPVGSNVPAIQATAGGGITFTGTSAFGINGTSGFVFDASGTDSSIAAGAVTLTGGEGGIHTASGATVTTGALTITTPAGTPNSGGILVDGGVVTTNGSTSINVGPGGTSNTFYNGVRVNAGGIFNANDALTIGVNSVAGSGVYVSGAGATANVDSHGKAIQITLTNPQNSGINNVNEAAALRADTDTSSITVTGNAQLAASQGRGYGLWTGVGGGSITMNGNTSIHTFGDQGFGIRLDAGTQQLNGNLAIETGVSPATGASGVGSAAMRGIAGTLNVTGTTTINTVGGITPVGSSPLSYTYESAYGIWNTSASRIAGTGAAMTFGGPVTITTSGPAAHGIYNDSNSGTVTFQGPVNVSTTGGSGSVTWYRSGSLAGTNETVGAWGVNNALGGTTTFQGLLTVNTTQATSGGVRSIGGLVDIQNGANITTNGANAYGVYASGKTSPSYNGTIQLSGPTSITTNGAGAHAVFADQAGRVVLNGATIRMADQSAFGVLASANSNISGTGSFDVVANMQSQNNAQLGLTMTPGSTFTGATTRKDGSTFNLNLQDSTWNLTASSNLSNLVNDPSQIIFAAPVNNTFKTLTVQNYSGNGTIALNTVLAGDGAPSDKLVVDGGTATGASKLRINNVGGAGALTVANGIQVVEAVNGGTTAPAAFALDGRAVAGVYEYRLFRGATDGTDGNSWYLRSDAAPVPPVPPVPPEPPTPPEPSTPLYRPEVAAYLANQHFAGQMFLHSLHDRLGEPQYVEEQGFNRADDKPRSGWLRMVGKWEGSRSADGIFKTTTDSFLLHGGAELAKWKLFRDDGADRGHLGLMGSYGFSSTDASARDNPFKAKGKVEGWSVGAYGTWYQNDEQKLGAYVDTWFQYGWFTNRVEGQDLPTVRYNAQGWAASAETGYAMRTRSDWIVEPQGQLIYSGYNESDFTEQNGTRVSGANSNGWTTRLGVRLHRTYVREEGKSTWQPYLTLNWWHTGVGTNMTFDGVSMGNMYPSNRYEVKIGTNTQFNKRWTGWANVGGAWGAQSFYQYAVRVGMKYAW